MGSFWGGFGWLEASLPTAAVVIATVVLVGALGVAFWRGRVWAVRLRLALFAFPTVALAVLVFFAGVGVLALVVWTLVEVGRAVHGSLSPPPPRRRPAA